MSASTVDVTLKAPPPDPSASFDRLETVQSSNSLSSADNEPTTAGKEAGEEQKDGSKRPLMTHTKDGKQLSEKKLRRLEKNRLSARECRRRKREATENLQHQINAVEAENLQLRLQLQIGQEAESCIASEQSRVTQDINSLLQSGASEADIYATLEEFKEKYADYGKSRRSSIEFHLRQIERLLMPTQTTSVVMHAIQGGEAAQTSATAGKPAADTKPTPDTKPPADTPMVSVSDPINLLSQVSPSSTTCCASVESTTSTSSILPPPETVLGEDASAGMGEAAANKQLDPKTLFRYLVQYLEVTPQQAAAMKDSRLVAREMDGCLETSLGVLAELRTRLAQTGEDLETEFTNVRSILTPTQAAKFLVWVADNSACMHMLNELWDRVYPQPEKKVDASTESDDVSTSDSPTVNEN